MGSQNKFKRIYVATMVLIFSITTFPVYAHHSFAMFDLSKKVEIHGVVKEFQWTNPHVWIQLIVTEKNGKETEWSFAGAPINMLARRGWKNSSLKPGDEVTITGSPLVDGRPAATFVKILFPDGRVLTSGSPQ